MPSEMEEDVYQWYAVLLESREQKKEWTERETEAKAQITRLLGARDAELQLRGEVVLRAVNRPGVSRLDTVKLKKELPDIATRFMTTGAGSYRLELVDPLADAPLDE